MEIWNSIDGVTCPATSMDDMFWDSGNWGGKIASATMTSNVTSPKHSGNYAAKLETKSAFGVIAAGNLFTGHFEGTENVTKGILGWGRPFTGEPKALKVWAKYTPAKITKAPSGTPDGVAVGDMDTGIIYVGLVDNSTVSYKDYTWPVIVRTADLNGYSFKKDGANVIAYGEHVFSEATAGDELIEITIPIEYVRQGVTPSNIVVVCSASRYGDYYCGGPGSTLIVDDFKLVY